MFHVLRGVLSQRSLNRIEGCPCLHLKFALTARAGRTVGSHRHPNICLNPSGRQRNGAVNGSCIAFASCFSSSELLKDNYVVVS